MKREGGAIEALRRSGVGSLLRVTGRLVVVAAFACTLGLVAMQFQGIVVKNVAIARDVSATHADIRALRERKARQLRTIRRLDDAAGAIPEIHDKLRLVGKHEEIIYVRGGAEAGAHDAFGTAH